MTLAIRLFLVVEAAVFTAPAAVHSGLLLEGHAHEKARIAESVIAVMLLAGSALTWVRPGATRRIGLAAQALALLGTLVGAFTIAIGVGPRTALDIACHIGLVVLLVSGLIAASRAPTA